MKTTNNVCDFTAQIESTANCRPVARIVKTMQTGRAPFPSPPFPTLPSPPLPSRPSLPLPLEVGPLKSSWEAWESAVSSPSGVWGGGPPPAGSGAEAQPKSILVHVSVKIWHLVATTILMIFVIKFHAL